MRRVASRPVAVLGVAAIHIALALGSDLEAESIARSWSQWGGPTRDFKAPAGELAASWPEAGPPTLWRRPLGDGYSAILFEAGRLYTMYRQDGEEVVVCLDAATGASVWERRYDQPLHPKVLPQYGIGPRSTPLISGDRLFTVGIAGRMLALDKADGTVLWSRELWGPELGGRVQGSGYSSSPLAYRGTVIVPVGGETAGVVAFDERDGSIAWKSAGFENSYSSPTIVELAGRPQLVTFMADALVGLEPTTGALLWRYPHGNQWNHNINMPTASGDMLFLSSPMAGSKGIRLRPAGAVFEVEEIWSTRGVQLYHVASIQTDGWVYGSSGVTSPAFLVAVNIRTGEIGWRERGVAKANVVAADGRIVILDEEGMLYLATATPEALRIDARAKILGRVAWTVPTLVGTTLYARDKRDIVALGLGSVPD